MNKKAIIIAGACLMPALSPAQWTPQYTVKQVGAYGLPLLEADCMNNLGQIGGRTINGMPAIQNPDDSIITFPLVANETEFFITGMNDVGQLAGWGYVTEHFTELHAILFDQSGSTDVSEAMGDYQIYMYGQFLVNNNGQVSGELQNRVPFLWDPVLGGYIFSPPFGSAIFGFNNSGIGVGNYLSSQGPLAEAWSFSGPPMQLQGFGGLSTGGAINNAGAIVGSSTDSLGNTWAVVFNNGAPPTILPSLPSSLPNPVSGCSYINNLGDIIGSTEVSQGVYHPWILHQGQIFDLTNLPQYRLPNFQNPVSLNIQDIMGFNDKGQLLIFARPGGVYYETLLLTPAIDTISVTTTPAGAGTVTGAGQYNGGATVNLVAVPVAGATFLNWTLNGTVVSTSPAYSFTASADESLVANFAFLPAQVVVAPNDPTGGSSPTGTINLGSAAPNDITFALESDSSLVSVPPTATIPAGQAAVTFPVVTMPTSVDTIARVSVASAGQSVPHAKIIVLTPRILSITCPGSVIGGRSDSFTITLDQAAPAGGYAVQLTSTNPAVDVSIGSVTVPQGSNTLTFTLPTTAVTAVTSGDVFAIGDSAGRQTKRSALCYVKP